MTQLLNPYISFDGNAREAMEFYQGVFGGSLDINTYGELGEQDSASADKVMHSRLSAENGFTLMAADTPPGFSHQPGNNVAVSLSGNEAEALRGYWDKLSANGTVAVPFEKQIWGDEFGQCTDRFGVVWMVDVSFPAG